MPAASPGAQHRATAPAAALDAPYWDSVYQRRGPDGMSWYQATPGPSLDLIRALGTGRPTPIIDVGAGASPLAGRLAAAGFGDVTALDVSAAALQLARRELAPHPAAGRIRWIEADLLTWRPQRTYGLWHDRAVFHFLTRPAQRATYLATLRAALRPGGAVILATFAPDGPAQCSGLPVTRYSAAGLARQLGAGFTMVTSRSQAHLTPTGASQPFTWIAAVRTGPRASA